MDIFRQHEIFEIDVLEKMNSMKVLEPLVFGGGSMLRLCHELNRYSVALDFWIIKKISQKDYFERIHKAFDKVYEITDSQIKHYTILFELRSTLYPKRLKIEIRREIKDCDFQKKIAFSKFSTKQVVLKAHTLEQTMKNKIAAFLERGEIRDSFDIEFLLRRGVELSDFNKKQLNQFQKKLKGFKEIDFKVKLGSILESDIREYYFTNRFKYLEEKLASNIFDIGPLFPMLVFNGIQ
ncbi:MAG: nucleotidyl transferase AbiEii/AbiGii toxin family protein [Desulfobacterales bacterium]|nr:nucleotidyl transferase AbiEii/AbiGii toxin family protein [Desulfobacterales bacterium]